ncbi:GGDEF domain-containing protein [Bosea sp. NBC_00550]|uniref:GGDEF domain-containing protein n=1 Tax=Bosea sp. NBC_00550 TaxID=2969621 RepID=UPI002231E67B|nr:GGDEF domain-containing protein [Bosea sp. NBC_00550]UZF90437.1 GGDEF domain-containing protein [Bosea sp. NBC_00550]
MPIISIVAYVASGANVSARAILAITLLATLAGTAFAFVVMRHLLLPVGEIARNLRSYRLEGRIPRLIKARDDDVGRLTDEVRALINALEDKMTRLKRQAFSDMLTGLGNRRWLAEAVSVEIARARREQRPLSVIVFDLDHFKRINDDFGHDVGDEVLLAVAETSKRVLRPYDLVARLGGEEFCAFLPATSLKEALPIAERLREGIASLQIDSLQGRRVTASFGVHEADVVREQFKDMLRTADQYLYQAKGAGRNQVQALEARRAVVQTGAANQAEP